MHETELFLLSSFTLHTELANIDRYSFLKYHDLSYACVPRQN